MIYKLRCLMIVVFLCITTTLLAQLPNNLSRVKSTDISDAQLQEFITKAQNAGLSENQVIDELRKRKMQEIEIEALKSRIAALISPSKTPTSSTAIHASRTNVATQTPEKQGKINNIFGAEIFSNPNLSFEPDLRLPTPKNYTLGPDDKLLLDVYGINLSQQNLVVSPEGTVYVKYAGPIQVNGLTIEEASKIINSRLAKFYPAIASGQTKVILSLTGIRAIKVMVLGSIKKPGTYSLSSLATLFNALYVSGGPTENGSFRNIQLVRNNKVIVVADLYDFLLNSNQAANVRLMDNDVIKIPYVNVQIDIEGEVNRPGKFEIQPNETLQDAIRFAGGYNSHAFKARVTGIRNTDFDKVVLDIVKDSIINFIPQNGDSYTIGSIINKFKNRLVVEGAVFKPGNYSLNNHTTTITDLLSKAEGLREDAFTGRALIIRTKEDLTKEVISINLTTDEGKNFVLQKEDVLQVSSIFDIKDNFIVNINGAVRNPGIYNFDDSLSLKALILKAGGFAENATGVGIEIARRKRNIEINNPQSPIVEIIKIDDDKDLSNPNSDIPLKPFDIITIKTDPYYKSQVSVSISGEVVSPGVYTLTSRSEKISDLIKRAGGTLYTANIDGARLVRKIKTDGADVNLISKIAASAKDSSEVTLETERKNYKEIAINLAKIIASPGSKDDILLEEGDRIEIPAINNMVAISGEVFNPIIINYEASKKLRDYLDDAGGVAKSGNKKRVFVIYPNGKAGKTKKILGIFRQYPKVTAGSKIFVPKDPEKKATDYAKASIIVTGISSLIMAVALAWQISK